MTDASRSARLETVSEDVQCHSGIVAGRLTQRLVIECVAGRRIKYLIDANLTGRILAVTRAQRSKLCGYFQRRHYGGNVVCRRWRQLRFVSTRL